jgi:hypothetical protein
MIVTFRAATEGDGACALRLHDLRHACATIPPVEGEHPRYVQTVLSKSYCCRIAAIGVFGYTP